MSIHTTTFATLPDGRQITQYRLTNSSGNSVELLSYGGILRSIQVPDRQGRRTDVVLGFDDIRGYLDSSGCYYGALVGRYANRIAQGEFSLEGNRYSLSKNDGRHHLHGGPAGFHTKIWKVCAQERGGTDVLVFTGVSEDGEEHYPGRLELRVEYSWDEKNQLAIEYWGETSRPTVLNLTNHAYFNLSGHGSGPVDSQFLQIYAERYTPTDNESIPVGELADVSGTVMDFRLPKPIGSGLVREEEEPQLRAGQGYDHNFVLEKTQNKTFGLAAEAFSPETGIRMKTYTDMPGIQFYGGNYMGSTPYGKNSCPYGKRHAFCLETQFYPDSIHHPDWPSPICYPGQTYHFKTVYAFDLREEDEV